MRQKTISMSPMQIVICPVTIISRRSRSSSGKRRSACPRCKSSSVRCRLSPADHDRHPAKDDQHVPDANRHLSDVDYLPPITIVIRQKTISMFPMQIVTRPMSIISASHDRDPEGNDRDGPHQSRDAADHDFTTISTSSCAREPSRAFRRLCRYQASTSYPRSSFAGLAGVSRYCPIRCHVALFETRTLVGSNAALNHQFDLAHHGRFLINVATENAIAPHHAYPKLESPAR